MAEAIMAWMAQRAIPTESPTGLGYGRNIFAFDPFASGL